MTTQITLNLPDEVYRRAKRLAQLTNQDVASLIAQTLEVSLLPLGTPDQVVRPLSEIPDDEVLALTELQMSPAQDKRLSILLDHQQAGTLTESERGELLSLMQIYQVGLLRKAQALHEAVRRGLRAPIE